MTRQISATQAARRFSEVLDALEYGREDAFYVQRHGSLVARIEAAKPRSVTWREALELLRRGPLPDREFAADLAAARDEVGVPEDPWARS